ncbi:hypothetical protein HNY73_001332 [Argiope bruennichi]|uniref:Uncharacterized protein n=1 Tax=Argiope bruennichi TaxID=94029 RepID=A0A8T0G284_ARGBR|nr:hypothetical protein HNY73_001332 [Argiope bruennichi]
MLSDRGRLFFENEETDLICRYYVFHQIMASCNLLMKRLTRWFNKNPSNLLSMVNQCQGQRGTSSVVKGNGEGHQLSRTMKKVISCQGRRRRSSVFKVKEEGYQLPRSKKKVISCLGE